MEDFPINDYLLTCAMHFTKISSQYLLKYTLLSLTDSPVRFISLIGLLTSITLFGQAGL